MLNPSQQRQQEIQKMLQEQQQLQQYNQNKQNLIGNARQLNSYRNRIGNFGQMMSKSSNPTISNIGNKIYNGSGNPMINNFKAQGVDALKSSQLGQKFGSTQLGAKLGFGSAGTAGAGTAGTTAATTGATAAGTGAATGAAAGGTAAAGAGTAAAGSTAAAGGGAAAGAAGASAAVPVAGWIAAAAIIASQMYKSHKNKQAAKAAEKSMKALGEIGQQSEQRKEQAMQGLEQQNAQNEAEVEAMSNNQQTQDELKQDLLGQTLYPEYYQQPQQSDVNTTGVTGINEQQTTVPQQTSSQMSSSPVAQEILSQIQGQDYSNQYSPYSSNAIEEEIRRRGLQ